MAVSPRPAAWPLRRVIRDFDQCARQPMQPCRRETAAGHRLQRRRHTDAIVAVALHSRRRNGIVSYAAARFDIRLGIGRGGNKDRPPGHSAAVADLSVAPPPIGRDPVLRRPDPAAEKCEVLVVQIPQEPQEPPQFRFRQRVRLHRRPSSSPPLVVRCR